MAWQLVTSLRGPAGRDGEGAHYEQRFTGDSNDWSIEHNLGSEAVVIGVYDAAGDQVLADVTVVDANNVHVHHDYPTAGYVVVQR